MKHALVSLILCMSFLPVYAQDTCTDTPFMGFMMRLSDEIGDVQQAIPLARNVFWEITFKNGITCSLYAPTEQKTALNMDTQVSAIAADCFSPYKRPQSKKIAYVPYTSFDLVVKGNSLSVCRIELRENSFGLHFIPLK